MAKLPELKNLIADPGKRIELHDLIVDSVQSFIKEHPTANLADSDRLKGADLQEALVNAHGTLGPLVEIVVLLGYWAEGAQSRELEEIFNRLVAANMGEDRQLAWGTLNWYPTYILLCAAGIGAISSKNFRALRAVLAVPIRDTSETTSLAVFILTKMIQFDESFKSIPGHEKHRVPRSEYLLISLRELVEPHLKLDHRFEGVFDEFEVLLALIFASSNGRQWGPPGRFAYKQRRTDDPLDRVSKEAEGQGEDWEVLHAGFFDGSFENFNTIRTAFTEQMSSSLW
jgi:hypothetical protein